MEAYANPKIHEAIQIWKYYQDVAVEPVLYRWLQQAHKRMQIPILPLYAAPIPLHRQRARERGFDQANRVALWVEQLYGLPVEPLLMRNRYTLPQAKQSGRSVGELDQVFSLHPDVVEVPEHVLLCDDVFTSGATMDAAARVLKQAGARTVWGFVLGRS